MRKLLLQITALTLLSSPLAPAFAGDLSNWTTKDKALEAIVATTLAIDMYQTLNFDYDKVYEGNKLLGSHPSDLKVVSYFTACTIAHVAITDGIKNQKLRTAFQLATILFQTAVILHNEDVIKLDFEVKF